MSILSIIILIIGIALCTFGCYKSKRKIESLRDLQNEKEILEIEKEELENQKENLQKDVDFEKELYKQTKSKVEDLRDIQLNYEQTAFDAYVKYCETLDKDYQEKESEYISLTTKLEGLYDEQQKGLLDELKKVNEELVKIKETYAAAIEMERKEKEIEAHPTDYCPMPTQDELDDIEILNRIKPKLNQPRILCMLIWSTYYQKLVSGLCSDRLGINTVSGIYKITNTLNNKCYIGQSVNVADRWKQHAKCGLGIDTPAGNKLYKAMLEDGLHNFAFELIEKCSASELNEKEKFYIELYQSKEFGYNGTGGNK